MTYENYKNVFEASTPIRYVGRLEYVFFNKTKEGLISTYFISSGNIFTIVKHTEYCTYKEGHNRKLENSVQLLIFLRKMRHKRKCRIFFQQQEKKNSRPRGQMARRIHTVAAQKSNMVDGPSKQDPLDDDSSSSENLAKSFRKMNVTDGSTDEEPISDTERKFLSRTKKLKLKPVDNVCPSVSPQKAQIRSSLKSFSEEKISDTEHNKLKNRASKPVDNLRTIASPQNSQIRSAMKSSGSSRPKFKREVSFKNVVVRGYCMTLGDNPSCSFGPPVCLDWNYEDMGTVTLERYEAQRGKRRTLRQMVMSYYLRVEILERAGHNENEIKSVTRQVNKHRRQRETTKFFAPVMGVESALKSAGRKAKRAVGGPKKE
jgi:hypothetical protein